MSTVQASVSTYFYGDRIESVVPDEMRMAPRIAATASASNCLPNRLEKNNMEKSKKIGANTIKIRIKKTRSEKLEDTRKALLEAAIEVIAEDGYADASIEKISARANVAKGTFYNYFDARQVLFDQLLPNLGERLLEYIRAHLDDSLTGIAREKKRIEAYFDFCRKTPGFLRVLNEAEVFAPKAYHRHIKLFYEGYLRSLERSMKRGDISGFDEEELGVVVFMLMGMRSYLTMLYQYGYIDRSKVQLEQVIETYSKFVDRALFTPLQPANHSDDRGRA